MDLKNLCNLLENSAGGGGFRVQERTLLRLLSVFENTPEKLIVKSIFPIKVAATLLGGSRKGAVRA